MSWLRAVFKALVFGILLRSGANFDAMYVDRNWSFAYFSDCYLARTTANAAEKI